MLSHVMSDGTETPVAFAFRSLSPMDKNYSQLDKEALAIVFGIKKCHQYLFGCKFQLISDPLNGQALSMELDIGATFSVINEDTYRSLGKYPPKLGPAQTLLRTYLGEKIPLLGSCTVKVGYGKQAVELPVIVVQGRRASLFGRDWLRHVRLDLGTVLRVDCDDVQSILNSHPDVFKKELGEMKDTKVNIYITVPSQPRFSKHRNIAYALRDKVENELKRLEQQGVIKPVKYSEWAAPILPVKSDQSSVRICGDYKLTVNQVAKPDCYPIPRIEDMFVSLSGGQKFTKLDMSNAYKQLVLDDESKKLSTPTSVISREPQ